MSWKSLGVLVATLAFCTGLMAQDKQSEPNVRIIKGVFRERERKSRVTFGVLCQVAGESQRGIARRTRIFKIKAGISRDSR